MNPITQTNSHKLTQTHTNLHKLTQTHTNSHKLTAITLRCLELTVAYIPRIRRHFLPDSTPAGDAVSCEATTPAPAPAPTPAPAAVSSSMRMSREFERISAEYSEHIENLLSKFHAILDSMLLGHLEQVVAGVNAGFYGIIEALGRCRVGGGVSARIAIDIALPLQWEAKAPVPSNSFREIIRKLSKLHSDVVTLWPLFSVQVKVTDLRQFIWSSFGHHLARCDARL